MSLNMQDLADVLGIGRASLFCCRTGKRPITGKTWLKLEAAERAAGIGVDPPEPVVAAVTEDSLEARIAHIEQTLERLTAAVESLACAQAVPPTSSEARGERREKSA